VEPADPRVCPLPASSNQARSKGRSCVAAHRTSTGDSRPLERLLGEIAELYGMRDHGEFVAWKRLGRLETLILRLSVLRKTRLGARPLSTQPPSCRGPHHSLPPLIELSNARCRSSSHLDNGSPPVSSRRTGRAW